MQTEQQMRGKNLCHILLRCNNYILVPVNQFNLKSINLFDLFLWTFRRNERDVIRLYDCLSDIMRLATGGDMLNFGYWDSPDITPLHAQQRLCSVFGNLAQLYPNQRVLDVGSGYGAPALQWQSEHGPLDLVCLNINFDQLKNSQTAKLNATAVSFPFRDSSLDRVLAFESAQHFKPLTSFVSESYRVLTDSGILALAIPVMSGTTSISMTKLGLLSMTWSSEHYSENYVLDSIKNQGFEIISLNKIGTQVYDPLSVYYEKNRNAIKAQISDLYPGYVEKILYSSIKKMQSVSQNGIIDYMLISCKKI